MAGTDPDLDPVAFALAHAAEDGHDQIVCLVVRIDQPAHLGHPELDAVVMEQRHGEPELIAVEGAVRLPDHDRLSAMTVNRPVAVPGSCCAGTV